MVEIVLVIGANGFLGQHIVRELHLHDDNVTEIRTLDLISYKNKLYMPASVCLKPVKCYIGDICQINLLHEAFLGVHCVIHCAALVQYHFPQDKKLLWQQNVNGTQNVINLCLKYNISRLIFTSTAEVTFSSYFMKGTFSMIIHETEFKAQVTELKKKLFGIEYVHSKLEAEKLILKHNGVLLKNGDKLKTVCIRPTYLYGELDTTLISNLISTMKKIGKIIPKCAIFYGLQQLTYAGNAAWAHILAKNMLLNKEENISGLPIFVTDDTPIKPILEFCEEITTPIEGNSPLKSTKLCLPFYVTYAVCFMLNVLMYILNFIFGYSFMFSPTEFMSLYGSVSVYSRLRAAIHLQYAPIYEENQAKFVSTCYYTKIK